LISVVVSYRTLVIPSGNDIQMIVNASAWILTHSFALEKM